MAELLAVLVVVLVTLSLVILRFDWSSQKQQVISEARRLGQVLATQRERAQAEETTYVLRLDAGTGRYSVVRPGEPSGGRPAELYQHTVPQPLKLHLDMGGTATQAMAVFLDARGVLPELRISVSGPQGHCVVVRPDPLLNEVHYDQE